MKNKLKGKLMTKVTSCLMAFMFCTANVPAISVDAATVITENKTGTEDGYAYELWKDSGNTSMTLNGNGNFSCEWNNINNCLFRKGQKFDCTQTYQDLNGVYIDYGVDYKPNGNSYMCVYGWTRNPLVEYYIVETWGSWRPPGATYALGTITVDGGTYDIYKTTRVNMPSIDGDTTFDQYWSVRQNKPSANGTKIEGRISVSKHFEAWEKVGLKMGKMYEVALNIEGYQSSGSANVYKNVLTIGKGEGGTTPSTPAVEPDSNGYYFHSTFESSKDDWQSRGNSTLSLSGKSPYAGKNALLVEGRTDTWHGAAYTLNTSTFVPGSAYSFSVGVLQNSGSTQEMRLTLQYQDASGETQYDTVASANAKSTEWTKLENTAYTIPSGASDLLLYVENADSTADFYMDEAIGAVKGTASTVTTGQGTSGSQTGTTDPGTDPGSSDVSTGYLKDAFAGLFKFGTSVSPNELNSGATFIKNHFNSITPENELKPDAILNQSASQQYGNNVNPQVTFNSGTQATLKFCEQNGISMRGHTFVWYSQTPDWFFRENFSSSGAYVSKEIMNQRMENFIKNTFELIAKDYPNLDLYAYDVVNEAFLNDGGGLRDANNSNWTKIYGDSDEFIINAFTYARKYAPAGCKLYINDYNEYIPAKTNDLYNIAMKLKEKGLIDGIGMQSHLDVGYPSASLYKTALEKFISTGLDVQITELDITTTNESSQAALYKEILQLAVDHADSISSVTVWGTHDSISWRSSQNPLLFGANYTPKQAYTAVMEVAKNATPPQTTTTTKITTTTTKATTTTTTTKATTTKATTTTTTQPVNYLPGDANCDGKVDISDAVVIKCYLISSSKYPLSAQGAYNADVQGNRNGVNAQDAVAIQKYILRIITSFDAVS